MTSLINTEVKPFKATAFQNGKFIEVTELTWKANGLLYSSTQLTSLSFAHLKLGDLKNNYAEFQKLGVEIYSVSTDTHFTIKLGTILQKKSKNWSM